MAVSKKILLLIIVTTVFTGCRKGIEHELGLWQVIDEPAGGNKAQWSMMDKSPENIYSIQAFENKLYLAGENESGTNAFLYYLTDSAFYNALPGTIISGPITDLQIVGSRMWAGGSFSYHQSFKIYENLMYVENGAVSGIIFGDWLYSEVEGLTVYNNDLIVRGWFHTKLGHHPGIKTSYIERIRGTSVVGFGLDVLEERVNDFTIYDDKLYVSGEGEFINNVHLCGFWDGNAWQNSDVFDRSGILDNGFGMESFLGDLFFVHTKTWATDKTIVQRFDGTSWHDVDEVGVFGGKRSDFKVINNTLYFYGDGITVDGAIESNVVKFDGTSWEAVGALTRPVVDVEIYKGVLYAATKEGLYKFD